MLAEAIRRGKDVRPFLKQTGAVMIASVEKTFVARGRPKKWKKPSDMTLNMRDWRQKKFGHPASTDKILEVSGDLRSKWDVRVRGEQLEVGSGMAYSGIHQFGKTIKAPKSWKTRSTVDVDQRILIQFLPEDVERIGHYAHVFTERMVGGH